MKLKKVLIISFGLITILLGLLIAIPYFYKADIEKWAKTELNAYFDAKIQFENTNLSLLRNFPNLSVKLENFEIVGKNEFKNDTLLKSKNINLIINVKSLFADNGYDILNLEFNQPKLLIKVLENGKANWEIWKSDTTELADTTAMQFHWKLKRFKINEGDIVYNYMPGNMLIELKGVNHATNGDLTADSSLLKTETTCDSLSFIWDKVAYISKAKAVFNADINANLNDFRFDFSENSSKLNDLEFTFNGWLKSIPEGWDMDIRLKTNNTAFKSLLSIVPAIYSNSFQDIKTGGNFDFNGEMKGLMTEDYYPAFKLKLNTQNAWFHYPALPKKVEKINIDALVSNPGKTLDETTVSVQNFSFAIANNPLKLSLLLTNPMSNARIIANADGKIDLANIKEVYPLNETTKLNGLIAANLKLNTTQAAITKNDFANINFAGKVQITQLEAESKEFAQKIRIEDAQLGVNNNAMDLSSLKMSIGKNDIQANGKLENFLGYALQNQVLKGNLNVNSNHLNANDFLTKAPTSNQPADTSKTPTKIILIPENIQFNLNSSIKELKYLDMNFKNFNGNLKVANSELSFNNVAIDGFGGNLLLNGLYSTADTLKPKANIDIKINNVVFNQVFEQIETLRKFAPIIGKAAGRFNTSLQFSSIIKSDMTPDLKSIVSGGAFRTSEVGLKNVPAIDALAQKLNKSDIIPLVLKDLALFFNIENGKVITKPFSFKVKDTNFNLGGYTTLNKEIAYSGKVQLPDKLNLGKFAQVNFEIGGTFQKPTIKLDLKNTASEIITDVKQKVETQVNQKIDDVKTKAIEEARVQKEKAMQQARQKADMLLAEAEKQANFLINEAKKQGDALIAKATNPLTKKAAEIAAKKLETEARKKADSILAKAKAESEKIINQADEATKITP